LSSTPVAEAVRAVAADLLDSVLNLQRGYLDPDAVMMPHDATRSLGYFGDNVSTPYDSARLLGNFEDNVPRFHRSVSTLMNLEGIVAQLT
jgi:hypothetical protein